jgi:hypothetical protein
MNRFAITKLFPFLLATLAALTTAAAEGNPPWNVSMAPSTQDRGFVTVVNQCTAEEKFTIYSEKPTVSWVEFVGVPNPKAPVEGPAKPPTDFTLASGEQTDYTIGFNTNGLQPGEYQTTVTVSCPECAQPACKYAGKKASFPINLTVTAPAKPPGDGGPGGGGSGSNGGQNPLNGGGSTSTSQNNPTTPTTTGTNTDPTTPSTTGTNPVTPTPPTTVSPVTPGGDNPGTNPTGGTNDPVPPTQSTNPGDWAAVFGGLLIASGLGLAVGSGKGGLGTQSRNPDRSTPPTTVRTTDNPPTPTQSKRGEDVTPGTTTKQTQGDWDVTGQSTPPNTTGGQSVTPNTTDKVPTGTPGTTNKPNGGDWNATGHGPISDQTATPVTPGTSEKNQGGASNTRDKSNPGDWDASGHGPVSGTGEKPQNANDNHTGGVPPTQEAPDRKQPGDWDAAFKTADPKPGDRNEGGGRTFARGATPGALYNANRPPTLDELTAVQKGISSGNDDYATREKKIQQRMADRQLNKESSDPIVAGGKTFVKVPWDGNYDPTGESKWIKGVRQDLTRSDVLSDTTRRKIREWQLEIYEDAYARARKAGLDNLAAHAAAQIALDDWLTQSGEQFEQMIGTHLAQIGQAVAADPIGRVNQAIAELGQLGEQAAANMQRTRELASTMERQSAEGTPTEVMRSDNRNSGNQGGALPENGAGATEPGTQRFTSLEAERASRMGQARARGLTLMGEEDIASQQASEAYVRMKSLGSGDPSSLARAAEYTDYGRQVLADPQCRACLQSEGLLTEMEHMVNSR